VRARDSIVALEAAHDDPRRDLLMLGKCAYGLCGKDAACQERRAERDLWRTLSHPSDDLGWRKTECVPSAGTSWSGVGQNGSSDSLIRPPRLHDTEHQMPRHQETSTERATRAKRETRSLDFKERFDPDSTADWTELVKDFMAMANSGGGLIVVGVCNDGSPAKDDVAAVLELDSAKITDKVERYTGVQFAEFEIHEAKRGRKKIAVVEIGAAKDAPIAFTKPGTYPTPGEKKQQKTAFSQGAVYFRHGAKSEPGTSEDLRAFVDRRLEEMRELWLGRMRQVIEAPDDARMATVQGVDETGAPTEIRLTDDPKAIVFGKLDPDQTHPFRQTELIDEVNRQLPDDAHINAHDILSVRRAHGIREATHPHFTHEPLYTSAQYSQIFADWIVEQYEQDREFFWKAREAYAGRA
jgi:hypothetical protein